MGMLAMLAMLAMRFPMLLPATPVSPPLPLSPPLELPLLPSPLSEELTLVPDVMSPTLLVSSMSPRGRLRLIPTFWDMAATQATDTPASAMAMLVMAMLAMAPTPPPLVLALLDTPLPLFQRLPGPMPVPADTVLTPPAQSTVPRPRSTCNLTI